MEVRKLMFPIALAILWVVMAAMAMVDFAAFNATVRPQRISVQKPVGAAPHLPGPRLALR